MTDWPAHPSESVVISTRNRPEDLNQTLQSVASQPDAKNRPVFVIDGSDPKEATSTERVVETWKHDLPFQYHRYRGIPAGTRQRNAGLDLLPQSVDIVHFIDDDVTVQTDYFHELSKVLKLHPKVGGVGGLIVTPESNSLSSGNELIKRIFFLTHPKPGRVLLSGFTTSNQHSSSAKTEESSLRETEWLSTCSSSYRRSFLDRHRFDESLTGYSMLEDRDLSYRISQEARLVIQPQARLYHRLSPRNRYDTERHVYSRVVHRRWFIEKHFSGIIPRLAYWWSLLGRFLATAISSDSRRNAALRGLRRGARTVWTRSHSLLHSS